MFEFSDLAKSAIGAVIGFALAQFVNIATLVWARFKRSKLRIEEIDQSLLLSHKAESPSRELLDEMYFGFQVRNVGRSIASGVRFQILKIHFREKGSPEFAEISDTALDLYTYGNADSDKGSPQVSLVPRAAVIVGLGWWREDYNVVRPLSDKVPDYYQEICDGAEEYKFDVVAFDDSGDFVTSTITVRPRI